MIFVIFSCLCKLQQSQVNLTIVTMTKFIPVKNKQHPTKDSIVTLLEIRQRLPTTGINKEAKRRLTGLPIGFFDLCEKKEHKAKVIIRITKTIDKAILINKSRYVFIILHVDVVFFKK